MLLMIFLNVYICYLVRIPIINLNYWPQIIGILNKHFIYWCVIISCSTFLISILWQTKFVYHFQLAEVLMTHVPTANELKRSCNAAVRYSTFILRDAVIEEKKYVRIYLILRVTCYFVLRIFTGCIGELKLLNRNLTTYCCLIIIY